MLSLQAISDRLELEDLTYAYAQAVDSRDFDSLEKLFTPDAHIDFSAYDGACGSLAVYMAWVRQGMGSLGPSHHLVANHRFEINGDEATGRVMCYNPLSEPSENGRAGAVFVCGLYYNDRYVRTQDGWRIKTRHAEDTYRFGTSPSPYTDS